MKKVMKNKAQCWKSKISATSLYSRNKAQMQISFGMIFSILLIIVFVAFAFFGIKKFMDIQSNILVNKFIDDLDTDMGKMWESSRGSQEVSYNLPKKIQEVCFTEDNKENVYFISKGDFDGGVIDYVNYETTLNDEEEVCFKVENKKVNFVIDKTYGEDSVTISEEGRDTTSNYGGNSESSTVDDGDNAKSLGGKSKLLEGVPLIHAQTFVIPENAISGDTVGDLNLMWVAPNQQVSFSLTNNENGKFSINSNGKISVATPNFDYDSKNEYQITARATDTSTGKYDNAIITIKLTKEEDTIFIDPSWNGCHTGTRECPYNSWSSVDFQTSKNYLQKRGTKVTQSSGDYAIISISADGTSSKHLIVGAYGSGNRPEVDCSSNPNTRSIFLGSGYNRESLDAANYVDLYSFIVHGCNSIRSGYGSRDLIFRDIEVYDTSDNGGIYVWQDLIDEEAENLNILIEDVESHDNPEPHGIKCQGGGVTARNLLLYNNGGHGISFPFQSAYNNIEYIIAYNNDGAGVEVGSAETTLKNSLLYNNYYGVEVNEDNNYDSKISNVVAYDNYAYGIMLWGSLEGVIVENSEFYNNEYAGIRLRSDCSVTLRNNEIYENKGNGIIINSYEGLSPKDVDILENDIHDNSEYGIYVDSGSDITISDNYIYDNSQSVYVGSSASNVKQSNNQNIAPVKNNQEGVDNGDMVIVYYNNFEQNTPGTDDYKEDWNSCHPNPNVRITQDSQQGVVFSENFEQGEVSLSHITGAGFACYYYFDEGFDEIYFSYKVKFESGFDAGKGGKLPRIESEGAAAGECPTGTDGFTGGMMFAKDGDPFARFYVYHMEQWNSSFYRNMYYDQTSERPRRYPTSCEDSISVIGGSWGTSFNWVTPSYSCDWQNDACFNAGETATLTTGEWHTITERVVPNTPGQDNGILEGYVDGKMVAQVTGLRFRTIDDVKLDFIDFTSFFGGSGADRASPKDQTIYFDDLIAYYYPDSEGELNPISNVLPEFNYPKESLIREEPLVIEDNTNSNGENTITGNTGSLSRLHVEGNKIVNEQGDVVLLRGVAIPEQGGHWSTWKDWDRGDWIENDFQEMENWNVNIVRMLISPYPGDMYYEEGPEAYFERFLDRQVDLAEEHGMYAMLDYHKFYESQSGVREEMMEFWDTVSKRYAGREHIIYELFNEPSDGTWENLRGMYEEAIDVIRANDPDAIVVANGLNWGYDIHYALSDPVRRPNVVYGTHPYPKKFPDCPQYSCSDERKAEIRNLWDEGFGDVSEVYPVLMTEVGWKPEPDGSPTKGREWDASTESFGRRFMDYLDEKEIGYAMFAFTEGYDTSLLSEEDNGVYIPSDYFGVFIKERLSSY